MGKDVMASSDQVKAYLACWLQMGKSIDVDLPQGQHQFLQPNVVLEKNRYSEHFEQIWRYVSRHPTHCYLSGTNESIQDLLSDRWDIANCSRCSLLLPMPAPRSLKVSPCPCSDLYHWPDWETLRPRWLDDVEETAEHSLGGIAQRLQVMHT